MNLFGILTILCLNIYMISCQSECKNILTCGGCIGNAYDNACVWCSAKEHNGRRCQSRSLQNSTAWCKEDVYDPKPYEYSSLLNEGFNDGNDGSKTVQFKPQNVKIKARIGVPIAIEMYYKPAKDYPLDVYYLMDFSYTMKKHADKLRKQGQKIHDRLTAITNNVKFGIGSFVEKPGLPLADPTRQLSYSFKHHLELTDNMTLFLEALKASPDGFNNDEPEAGLDALMQAMVCKKDVGWRDKANRIILLSTDSTYHSSGDGKFVGAIKPHDMKCYLVNNEYSMALTLDYPSVSQINYVATKNNIMIIFAVDPAVKNDYSVLETKIQNAKYVPLSDDSDVAEIIIKEYQELVSSVQLNANVPPFMSLTFNPDCSIPGKCLYKLNEPVNINGTLTVKSCPADHKFSHTVEVGPVSLDEKLVLNIEVDCQCDCEKSKGEENSKECSEAGTYQCGICNCNENRYGTTCGCNGTSSNMQDFEKCKANDNDSTYCSGRGTCSCGKCTDCQKGFSGDFCEFDDNSCPRPGGLLCSDRGKCNYGRCECDEHWLPDDCNCPDNDRMCIAPNSKETCSGNGVCVCGECDCSRTNETSEYCSGRYCDECEGFAAKRCKELEDYAYCNLNDNKMNCEKQFNLTDTEVVLVDRTEIYSPTWYLAKTWCRKVLEDGRILVFKYHYPKSATLLLIIQNELDMPPIADVWIAVGSVVGAVLLIGLLTIIAWKILVDLHDKREYEKFKTDSAAAGYDVSNPLYQEPATNFSNPAYCGYGQTKDSQRVVCQS